MRAPYLKISLAAVPTTMSPSLIVLILSMLMSIQPVTTDLYLPALTEGLGAPMSHAHLTLAALLLSFGGSQLIWRSLSDRFGRRPILLWGLAAFTLASIASTLAPSLVWLIGWRVVQGAAMGVVVVRVRVRVRVRAIVRDLYQRTEGARIMSKGLSGLGVLACVSAPLDGLLSELYGWRVALRAGFLMMVVVFGLGSWLGAHMDGTVHSLTNGAWFWSVLIATLAWTTARKYGDTHAAPKKL
jgi:DHA1 family bicyclomycin/chloramphenicol resistance-like MFS transporter